MNKVKENQSRNIWIKEDDPIKASNLSRHKDEFEDILEKRRHNSDLKWSIRSRDVPVYKYNKNRGPGLIKDDVLRSDRVAHAIDEIASERNVNKLEIMKEAREILKDMGHNLNMTSIRSFAFFLTKVVKTLYQRVYVNVEGIERVRAAITEYPVVLLPNHRSYADFLLMSYVFFNYDLPLPVIAAAMDFMSMKFFGSLLRNSGAFFIRRSFKSDRLYWAIFTEYVHSQLANADAPLEFFVEGTRSRTCKSYVPKKGMLTVVLEPYFKAQVPDVILFPVSISYDRILEESLYAYELLGVPKPKESTSGLIKAAGILAEDYGNVHMYFGEPISIRQFSAGRVDRIPHGLRPRYVSGLTDEEYDLCEELSYDVVLRHQSHMIISPWALISTVLLQNKDGIYLRDVVREVEWLKRCTANLGAYVDWPGNATAEQVIRKQIRIHRDIVSINKEDFLELKKIVIPHAGKVASNDMMVTAASHLVLASYRNQLVHCFIRVGLVALSVNACPDDKLSITDLLEKYIFLETLLKMDFIFHPNHTKEDFHHAVKLLANSGVLTIVDGSILIKKSTNKYNTFLSQMFEPFLLAYWIVCQYLMTLTVYKDGKPMAQQLKLITMSTQNLVKDLLQEGLVKHFDMLSLDTLSNCLNSLVNSGALEKEKREDNHYLIPNPVKISKIAENIGNYIELPQVNMVAYAAKSSNVQVTAKL